MAEAIARQNAGDVIVGVSGGTIPLGFVAPMTLRVLEERGYDVQGLNSTPISRGMRENAEIIINMTGSPADRIFPAEKSKTEDWKVTDPYGEEIAAYRNTCDEVEARLTEFAARLRALRSAKLAAPVPSGSGD